MRIIMSNWVILRSNPNRDHLLFGCRIHHVDSYTGKKHFVLGNYLAWGHAGNEAIIFVIASSMWDFLVGKVGLGKEVCMNRVANEVWNAFASLLSRFCLDTVRVCACCFILLTWGWGRLEMRPPVALGSSPELFAFPMSLAPPVHSSPIFLTDTPNL